MRNRFAVWMGLLGLLFCAGGAQAFTVSNAQISDDAGHPIRLNAVNWFGFDDDGYAPHGLWQRNWSDMIAQMKANGVNAVRIPLCPGAIHGSAVTVVNYNDNPDLKGLNSLQVLDKMVAAFDAAGIYILFDFHVPDANGISPLWYTADYSESQWLADLTFVAARYKSVPHALGWDIKNEPHGAATWGTGNLATDWNKAAERAAAALLPVAPAWLIFVEGIQDNPNDLCQNDPSVIQHFWGENLEPARCYPLNIPKTKLVFSPHIYGPASYPQAYFSAVNFPDNMPKIYDTIFGYLHDAGYAVVPTEWGGQYMEGDAGEDKFENNFVAYLTAKGMTSAFYWAFNGNGWPNGGLLQPDWNTINPHKARLLKTLWGTASTTGSGGGTPVTTKPAAPRVLLSLASTSVAQHQSTTATWSSANATACAASGPGWAAGARATSGRLATAALATPGSYPVSITCSGAGGSASASATLTVKAVAAPEVTVTLSSSSVKTYVHSWATWTSTNATSCTTYGRGWPAGSPLPTSGTAITYSFALAGGEGYNVGVSCTGPGGSGHAAAHLTVVP